MNGYDEITLEPGAEPNRIVFKRTGQAPVSLTPEQQDLRGEVLNIDRLLRNFFKNNSDRKQLFEQLLEICRDGLVKSSDVSDANFQDLEGLKDEISLKAINIRNRYLVSMRKLSALVLFIGAIIVSISIVLSENSIGIANFITTISRVHLEILFDYFAAFGYSLIGLAVGALLSSHLSNRILGFDDIPSIWKYRYSAGDYYFYLTIILIVSIIVMSLEVLWIGVAGMSMNKLADEPVIGLILGIVCGLAETKMADLLQSTLVPAIAKREINSDQ